MKKYIILLFFLLGFFRSQAQQIPLYSQYFDNPMIYNPSYVGLDRFGSFNLTHRSQWAEIKGAPETSLLSFDVPIYDQKIGLGMNIHRDKIGFSEQYKVMFNYAYHIIGRYVDSSVLSFGLSGGFISNQLNFANAFVINENDPKILNNTGNYMGYEFGFGLNYMLKDVLQIGFATPQLLTTGVRATDNTTNNIGLKPHYLLSVRCTLKTADEMHYIEPMVMARYATNTPFQLDFGIQYTFNRTFWTNVAYRTDYAVSLGLGLMLDRWRIGLAQDFAIGRLNGVAGRTVEMTLGYKFARLESPKYPKVKRNSSIRYKKYHPSIPGPLSRKFYQPKRAKTFGRKRK